MTTYKIIFIEVKERKEKRQLLYTIVIRYKNVSIHSIHLLIWQYICGNKEKLNPGTTDPDLPG